MKNIFLNILWILFVFFSCSNEELLEKYEQPTPIRFSSQCIDIATKTAGIISGNVLPQNTQISLFSLTHTPGIPSTSWAPSPFDNTLGVADAKGDILYDNTFYFPLGEELDFFAVHPVMTEINPGYAGEEEITFSLKQNTAEQFDLIYASLLNQSKKAQTLIFQFRHLLTQITFQFLKKEGVTVNLPLTRIEMTAPQQGTLNLRTGLLTPLADTNATFVLDTQTDINQTAQVSGQFLLFPQTATDIILTFGTDANHIYHVTMAPEEGEWTAGQNYQYTITINKDILDTSADEVTGDEVTGDEASTENPASENEEITTKCYTSQEVSIALTRSNN